MKHTEKVKKNLYVDTATNTSTSNETKEQKMQCLDLIIQEIESSTEREMRNIIKEMGADLIPLLISSSHGDGKNPSKQYLLRIVSLMTESSDETDAIILERMNNIHRLFRYIICQLQKRRQQQEDSCSEERKLTLFFLKSIAKIDSNKSLIVTYPGLLQSINGMGNPKDKDEVLFITQILNELSKDYDSKHFLGQTIPILNMLKNILSKVAAVRKASKSDDEGGNDQEEEAYMNAMKALKHISEASVENQMMILFFNNGSLFDLIIFVALDHERLGSSSTLVALQIINNLISRSTAARMLSCFIHLLQTLSTLAMECPLDDVSLKAAKTIEKLSLFIRSASVGNNNIPKAFLNMLLKYVHDIESNKKSTSLRMIGFKCFKKFAISKENRLLMANCLPFVTFVCEALASCDINKQLFATSIVYQISRCRQAARVLAQKSILIGRLLAIATQSQNANNKMSTRRLAIKSILTMVCDDIAALSIFQKDILSDLAVFVARPNIDNGDDDDELKRSSLKAIIRLTTWL